MGRTEASVNDSNVVVTAVVLSYKKKRKDKDRDLDKLERVLAQRSRELIAAVRQSERLTAADYEVRVY